jgi:hypothetical protein
MSNIQAPYVESYSTYKSYFNSNLLNNSYTFKIPVYSDMGGSTSIATKSNNNNLSALSISSCTLNPSFNSGITTYNCNVENSVSSVTVSATKADSKASITGTGVVNLNVGTNTVKISVTAEDGSTKTYSVTITRKEASSLSSSTKVTPEKTMTNSGYKISNGYVSGFTLGTDISKVISNIKSKNSSAKVKVYNSSNKEITSGSVSTGQKLVVKNNGEEVTYNVIVYGDTNGDGKISAQDFAKVKSHLLGATKLTGDSITSADTNKDGKISAQDFAKIKSHLLGASKLQQ